MKYERAAWWPRNPAPPRKRCGETEPHGQHLFACVDGLVWSCRGRDR